MTTTAGPRTLTAASEKLLRDFDQHPEAIDYSELSARLWLVEAEARADEAAENDKANAKLDAMEDSIRAELRARIAELEARADVDGLVAHPGEKHEFRTTCRRCGEPGQLHIALLGPDEGYSIGPLAGDKAEAPLDE